MPRPKHDADDEHVTPAPEPEEPSATEPKPAQAPEPPADNADLYEPFPGSDFFHGGRHSQIIGAMGRRLEEEGHAPEGVRLGQDWTNAHRRAFAAHQHTLRPKEGGDISGIPDEVAWKALRVPRVSTR